MKKFFLILTLLVSIPFASLAKADKWASQTLNGILELKWDDLVPADYHPEAMLSDEDFISLDDNDPRAKKRMKAYLEEVKKAPIIQELDGRLVKIPGFVVPLESDGEVMSEFLLVPYFGACIHTPPPPGNQIIHVQAMGKGTRVARSWYDTVWIIGRLNLEKFEHDLGNASYTIAADHVEPYDGGYDPGD